MLGYEKRNKYSSVLVVERVLEAIHFPANPGWMEKRTLFFTEGGRQYP